MLITLSLGNLEFLLDNSILPGAAAKRKFEVITTAIKVFILLLLNSFD
jgi:hypothetical protein